MIHALFLIAYLAFFLSAFFLLRSYGYVFPRPTGFEFLLVSLAVYRLTILITEDRIFKFLRAPFVIEKQVLTSEGTKTLERPVGRGLRRVVGELFLCGWCSGAWIAAAMVLFHTLFPNVAHAATLVLSVAACAILIQIAGKALDRSSK